MSSPPDPFEFLKSLWGPMGLPLAGLSAPTGAMSEVDRRIAELKSVETWLNMNLNVLRMSIQALEMQKAGLAAMQSAAAAATSSTAGPDADSPPKTSPRGEDPAKK
jgi:hypothetical protein